MSLPDLDDYRRLSTQLVGIGGYTVFDMRLLTDGPPVVVSAANINPDALSLREVAPALGRLLLPSEDLPGGDVNKVVIAHDVWQSIYGGDQPGGVLGASPARVTRASGRRPSRRVTDRRPPIGAARASYD
jgi:hypothetical protein